MNQFMRQQNLLKVDQKPYSFRADPSPTYDGFLVLTYPLQKFIADC